MIDPDVDVEDRNLIGGIDRLVTNFALAILAVVPTLAITLMQPWKLAPQLGQFEKDGRQGMLLSPGVFIALSLTITLLISAMLATPDTLARNHSLIGPDLALRVASAAEEGNIWKTVSIIAPIYLFAVLIGAVGSLLKRWAGPDWSLLASLRASFYAIAALVSWIVLSSAIIDLILTRSGTTDQLHGLYALNAVPILFIPFWVFTGLFRGLGLAWIRSCLLGLAIFALMFVIFGTIMSLMP